MLHGSGEILCSYAENDKNVNFIIVLTYNKIFLYLNLLLFCVVACIFFRLKALFQQELILQMQISSLLLSKYQRKCLCSHLFLMCLCAGTRAQQCGFNYILW